nr:hypothetical protein [Pseudonocardia sp. ICBG601]
MHTLVREGNTALDAGDVAGALRTASAVRATTEVLGLDPLAAGGAAEESGDAARQALGTLVESMLERRRAARAERDFATADRLRDELLAAGIAVEDGADGSTWTLKDA